MSAMSAMSVYVCKRVKKKNTNKLSLNGNNTISFWISMHIVVARVTTANDEQKKKKKKKEKECKDDNDWRMLTNQPKIWLTIGVNNAQEFMTFMVCHNFGWKVRASIDEHI